MIFKSLKIQLDGDNIIVSKINNKLNINNENKDIYLKQKSTNQEVM